MRDKTKNAFSVFVFGSYERFIPYYVYSIEEAYPDTDVIIFYNSILSKQVRTYLEKKTFVVIYENFYEEYNFFQNYRMRGGGGMTLLRFLIPGKYFVNYKNVYFGDVDIFILKENINLFKFHENQINACNLPFSNRVRYKSDNQLSHRLTGLHFVHVKPYFEKMDPVIYNILSNENYRNKIIKEVIRDEELLYSINKLGFNFDEHLISKNQTPLHGLHLGIFRHSDIPVEIPGYYNSHEEEIIIQLKNYVRQNNFVGLIKKFYCLELIRTLLFFEIELPKLLTFQNEFLDLKKRLFSKIKKNLSKLKNGV